MPLIFCPSDDWCTTWLFGNYAPNKATQKGQYASTSIPNLTIDVDPVATMIARFRIPSRSLRVSPSTRLEVVRYWPQLPQDPRLVSKKTSLWQMEKVEKCWKSAHDQPISTVHVAVPLLPRIEWVSYLGITPALYLLKRSYQLQSLLLSTLEPHIFNLATNASQEKIDKNRTDIVYKKR